MRIAFVWQGFSGRYGHWQDGLWLAMKHIEKQHEVKYFEPFQTKEITEFNPDRVLYWEAPCTINGKDKDNYLAVCNLPFKKALLFAGGPLEEMWVTDFDHVFVESKVNADDCERQGIPYSIAFGINDEIFKPEKQPKVFDGIHPATCASWKRQQLGAEALGNKLVLCGRFQETDPSPFTESRRLGALVLPELSYPALASLMNASHTLVQTSSYWGGGQRATLEAMACGVPPIVMEDSLKNREYVEESGFGWVCKPEPLAIKKAVEYAKGSEISGGVEYIQNKWTGKHYADSILKIIN